MAKNVDCHVAPELIESLVEIANLREHPRNPRVGNVDLIAESLRANKQYRPIVVRASDNVVLAGNHTFKAAKLLGWTHIAADIVDVDEEASVRIMIADNRTGDQAKVDDSKLVSFLSKLPSLEGTGYDSEFLRRQMHALNSTLLFKDKIEVNTAGHKRSSAKERAAVFAIGKLFFEVEIADFTLWLQAVTSVEQVVERLRWPETEEAPAAVEEEQEATTPSIEIEGEEARIADLRPIDGLPREGNVDRIGESLKANGQYRRVVVSKRTNTVIVNWHVVVAARKIGWKTVKAVYLDLTEEQERRIYLADNRSAQLAHYNEQMLCNLLRELPGVTGTGYSQREFRKLLDEAGASVESEVKVPAVLLRVQCKPTATSWLSKTTAEKYSQWYGEVLREGRYSDTGVIKVLSARLGLEPTQLLRRKV